MRRFLSLVGLGLILLTAPSRAALSVPLTVQEALYDSLTGWARTDEPFCMGVPLADSSAIVSTSVFGLTSATSGQFRILGTWPSGNAKWVKVCGIIASLSAGSTATVTLTDSGSGNFGGSNLATDGGSTISVDTGAAVFTVKKANFNVFDTVVVGGTTVVATSSSANRGLVVLGPAPGGAYPANVTCGTCTTVFSSANDASSTATIEENGPVMTVIRAVGTHKDGSGNPYMQYTARLTFYKGKTSAKVVVSLRNANYDTSATPSPDIGGSTFNSAYKGLQAYELRMVPNITGTLDFSIGGVSPPSGTLDASGGTDVAYIYQGASNWMVPIQDVGICGPTSTCGNTYTTDSGFISKKNGTTLASGDVTAAPEGWIDIANSSGVGMLVAMNEFAANWPASLELKGGGLDVRIGMFSGYNSQPVYIPWPHQSTREMYVEFHTSAPASFSTTFRKLQHFLLARASRDYYNSTAVFPYKMAAPADEDAYMSSVDDTAVPSTVQSNFCWLGGSTTCSPDRGTSSLNQANALAIGVYKAYVWPTGGPLNQEEFRWSDMLRFLQRGQTGRWVNSKNFYHFAIDRGMIPRADGVSSSDSTVNGFAWRNRPHVNQASPEVGVRGQPIISCGGTDAFLNTCGTNTNSDKAVVSLSFGDYIHNHWSGICDYYFLTGDELFKEALVPVKDFYLNANTYQGLTDPADSTGFPTRAVGILLIGASNYSIYLHTIGDADWDDVRDMAKGVFNKHVKTDTCVSGYPVGCTPVTLNTYPNLPDNEPAGVNRKRGVHTSNSFRGSYFCTDAGNPFGIPAFYRAQSSFQASILIEGLLQLLRATTITEWADYNLAKDLAYGVSQWGLTEGFGDDGIDHWFVGGGTLSTDSLYNGWRFGIQFDHSQVCSDPSHTASAGTTTEIGGVKYNNVTLADGVQGHWMLLVAQAMINGHLTTAQQRQLKLGLQWVGVRRSVWPADYGGYQLNALISSIYDAQEFSLQDVSFSVSNLGSGNYRLSWTVPTDATSYRIKWSTLLLEPSTRLLNFDAINFTFGTDPATHDTWFGSNQTVEPAVAGVGTTQTFDITGTGSTSLTSSNFSVKAYIGGAAQEPPPPVNPGGILRLRIKS